MLSCVGKLMERIVFKYLFNYLRDKNLISKDQSGFQPGDSTVNQLTYLYDFFCKALDDKKDVHIVFCDIAKAFDRVWHKGLIYKLKMCGVGGALLDWFHDYLYERYQRVIIRGQKSELGLIRAGVPQGSVLGPLLFLVYINDITLVTQTKMKLFADDTSVFIEFDENSNAEAVLNTDMDNIRQWADQWLVSFSPHKTKLLTCSFKKKPSHPIYFNDVQLQNVASHKHLGITFSSNLSWNVHIDALLKSVSPMSDVLKHLKYDLDRYSLERSYVSFIRPKLEYASVIWDNCNTLDSDRLEAFQLGIARTVTGARRGTSHASLYSETNWQTLKERRTLNKLKFLIKIESGQSPQYLQSLLPDKARASSRNSNNFLLPKTRTETYRNSFLPSTLKLWNELPDDCRNINYVNQNLKKSCNLLFYEGSRLNNIRHAQLRMNCSKLNAHLFSLHVVDTPACLCGSLYEDVDHYLFVCPLYNVNRQTMFRSLLAICNFGMIDQELLLFGSDGLDLDKNKQLCNIVHQYFDDTNRL